MIVRVRIDGIDDVMSTLRGAGKKPEPAIKKAVNEAAKSAKKKLQAQVKKEYVIKGFAAKDIKIKKATVSKLYAELSVSGSPLSLKKYYRVVKNRKRTAVKAAVKRGAAKAIQGKGLKAFVTTVQNKKDGGGEHVGVFQRLGKPRLPIKELKGPAISKLTEKIYQTTEPEINNELKDALWKFVDEILNGK